MNLKNNITREYVVVSMTSFPAAIPYAVKAIKSVLKGSVLPDKLVLYLTASQFKNSKLPCELERMAEENPIFEIRNYDTDIRSYRKLIPALNDFPEAVIVTVDDDVAYHRDMLKNLLRAHSKFPHDILAHRVKRINPDRPYKSWSKFRWYDFIFKRYHRSFRNLQTGVGGVLYPAHSLSETVKDKATFTSIAPTADDIWFWAMAVAKGTRITTVPFGYNKPKGLGKPRDISLKTINFKSKEDRNKSALDAILKRFPKIKSRLNNEKDFIPSDHPLIDLVYTWVDGNDPLWIAKRKNLSGSTFSNDDSDCVGRYANNDELKYSLRSVERYAPWIHKIYIITDRQIPEWLDISNPKIKIIDHTEIMPAEALPCFNSQVIEHCICNIPDLTEHFLYANDDTFINRYVSPRDFFASDGFPIVRMNRRQHRKLTLMLKARLLGKKQNSCSKAIQNAAELVKQKYGKYFGCKTHHNIDAYSKSTYLHAREIFDAEINSTLANHFRSDNDIQRNLYSYVALAEHKAHLRYVTRRTSFRLHIEKDNYKKLKRYNPLFFCLNDSEYASDRDRIRAKDFLERRFPDKSAFEKVMIN